MNRILCNFQNLIRHFFKNVWKYQWNYGFADFVEKSADNPWKWCCNIQRNEFIITQSLKWILIHTASKIFPIWNFETVSNGVWNGKKHFHCDCQVSKWNEFNFDSRQPRQRNFENYDLSFFLKNKVWNQPLWPIIYGPYNITLVMLNRTIWNKRFVSNFGQFPWGLEFTGGGALAAGAVEPPPPPNRFPLPVNVVGMIFCWTTLSSFATSAPTNWRSFCLWRFL